MYLKILCYNYNKQIIKNNMKLRFLIPFSLFIYNSCAFSYEYQARFNLDGFTNHTAAPIEKWNSYDSLYGNWIEGTLKSNCSNWTPLASSIELNQSFTQTATDCTIERKRTVQKREISLVTNEIRNIGDSYIETDIIQNISDTRNSIGTLDNDMHGEKILNRSSGTSQAIKMVLGTSYSGSVTGAYKGTLNSFSLLIGNYLNSSDGIVTINVCTSESCATGTVNVATSVDNKMLYASLSPQLKVKENDILNYTFTINGSTYTPAIWSYSGSIAYGTPIVSKISSSSYYPIVGLKYN